MMEPGFIDISPKAINATQVPKVALPHGVKREEYEARARMLIASGTAPHIAAAIASDACVEQIVLNRALGVEDGGSLPGERPETPGERARREYLAEASEAGKGQEHALQTVEAAKAEASRILAVAGERAAEITRQAAAQAGGDAQ